MPHFHGPCPHCMNQDWEAFPNLVGLQKGRTLLALSRYAHQYRSWNYSLLLAEEALAIFEADSIDFSELASAHFAIAVNLRELQRNEEAQQSLEMAISFSVKSDAGFNSNSENTRAWWAVLDKKYQDAHMYYRETVTVHAEWVDTFNAAGDLLMIGNCAFRINNYEEALRCFQEARTIFKKEGDIRRVAICDVNTANTLRKLDRHFDAHVLLEKAKVVSAMIEDHQNLGFCLLISGENYLAQGQHREAIEALNDAILSLVQCPDLPYENLIRANRLLAQSLREIGNVDEANEIDARLVTWRDILDIELTNE